MFQPKQPSPDTSGKEPELAAHEISDDLRARLEERREVEYVDYGATKVISTGLEGLKWSFSKPHGEWVMERSDPGGNYDHIILAAASDIEFLERLAKEDIAHPLRAALTRERSIDYHDHGERKVASVELDGVKYQVFRDSREYADWAMTSEAGSEFRSFDIREQADLEFLETLFRSDINDNVRGALQSGLSIGYDDLAGGNAITVEVNGDKYCFARVSNEYADWAMYRYSADGTFVSSNDIREPADVDLLERLESAS